MLAAGRDPVLRFTRGLGAVTNLTDRFPWGLWVGFDMLCGVGLAAGGFTLTTAVYIFNLKRFKPIVRRPCSPRSSATCWSCVGLMFDLGPAVEHLAPARHVEPALGRCSRWPGA